MHNLSFDRKIMLVVRAIYIYIYTIATFNSLKYHPRALRTNTTGHG
jgi:hypothetical protein